ncbi:hypothetical protein [Variovorax guangxiensis]|uniref:Glycosyltransferase family 1 protein n=1 Tax=Variovorax guangxiensis TaxID=1775474 RepID=A0A502DMN8_9BURK|nr:hypothetical protein [Variovorax guangxiensis]RZI66137.1 MAG: hypothetical protein EOP79_08810 [Variovorax sp.]TPG22012.1 hypothetical protein EAH83_15440 [Variovorax ginsengisoli]TPG25900.1 hypothetical protein EAH82_15925 [Variovorax guangxiensis]
MHAATSLSLIPPGTGGVRDYAALLGGPLDAPVRELSEQTDTRDWSGNVLLLHFSGYGFHKRGVPAWLLDELKTLRARFRVFGVVFHELYATGNPPWTSAFWLSSTQRRIARELAGQADFWLTNREIAGQWLRDQAPRAPHRVLPVFSNVGEPRVAEHDRDASIVVFGSAGIRAPSYAWGDGEIFRFAKRRGLRIYDIGAPLQDAGLAQKLVDEGVVVRGMLPAEQVSEALLSARHGVLAYPADFVAKSGIFAAYASHGTCPILLHKDLAAHDGMQPNVEYAAGFEALEGDRALDPWLVGRAARRWYEPHCVAAHTAALQALTSEVGA